MMKSYLNMLQRINQIQTSINRLNEKKLNSTNNEKKSFEPLRDISKEKDNNREGLNQDKSFSLPKIDTPNKLLIQRNHSLNDTIRDLKNIPLNVTKTPSVQKNIEESVSSSLYKTAGTKEKKFVGMIVDASKKYNVPESLIYSIIKAESNFNPWAISPKRAMGLMQLIPETANKMELKNPFDPKANVDAGTGYFKQLLDEYQGNTVQALAAYNAGKEALINNEKVPNYPETQNYVTKVMKNYLKLNGVKQ